MTPTTFPTIAKIRDSIVPSRAALRVMCGASTAIIYANRFGYRVTSARRCLNAAVARGELTRDVFGVYHVNQSRNIA